MDFILSALDYLLGIPVLGWGVQVGFVYKALLLLVALEDAAPLAALLCLGGLLVERWLFFAEARHTVNLYQTRA